MVDRVLAHARCRQRIDVLMVVDAAPPQYGGAGQQAALLASELRGRGLTIKLISRRKERGVNPIDDQTRFVGPYFRNQSISNAVFFLLVFTEVLLSHARVVHCHGAFHYGLAAGLAARLTRKAFILKVTMLGGDDPASIRNLKFCGMPIGRIIGIQFRIADCVVALNQAIYDVCRSSKSCRNVVLIPNGVRQDGAIQSRVASRGLGSEARVSKVNRVGFVGDVCQRKGVRDLVEAWRRFAPRSDDWQLVLIGPVAPDIASLVERAAASLGNISVTGKVSHEASLDLLSSCTMFVLPSFKEGLSNSLVEAMSLGIPCLVSDIEANRLVGRNYVVYCQPGSAESIVAGLSEASDRRSELADLSLARSRAFNINRIASLYEAMYNCREYESFDEVGNA